MKPLEPDPEELYRLANYKMPFGKYKGRRLIDIPEAYYVWFGNKGYPPGSLGDMMRAAYEIKVNGLEHLFKDLRDE